MINIHVKFDTIAVKRMQQEIPHSIIPTVLMRSLNKTLQTTQSTTIKTIANQTGVKQKILRDFLTMTKAQKQTLTAILSAPHKKRLTLLMIDPHAKQNARGVAYRIGGQRKQLDHAFMATMKSGHRGIYARKFCYLNRHFWILKFVNADSDVMNTDSGHVNSDSEILAQIVHVISEWAFTLFQNLTQRGTHYGRLSWT